MSSSLIEIEGCIQERSEYQAGSYVCSGRLSLPLLPDISVDGVGRLSFPVSASQCRELITVASRAPFGRGTQTLVDTAVRNTWQVEAAAVHVDSGFQHALVTQTLPAVCAALGLGQRAAQVRAVLYKLLLYEAGGFFSAHRDSEKGDGMFGTLVLLLPSQYEGGQLLVEHAGQRQTVDCSRGDDWRGFHYAAFYADCRHEIRPVTSGHRLALTYNLCLTQAEGSSGSAHLDRTVSADNSGDSEEEEGDEGEEEDEDEDEEEGEEQEEESSEEAESSSGDSDSKTKRLVPSRLPSAASLASNAVQRLAAAFLSWQRESEKKSAASFVVIPLAHHYTQSSISLHQLKNSDAELMQTIRAAIAAAAELQREEGKESASAAASDPLVSAAPVVPCLCFLERHTTHDEGIGSDDAETDCSISEIRPVPLSHSIPAALQSRLTAYQQLLSEQGERDVKESQLLHTDADFDWAEQDPDSEREEHTGNEGTTVDRFYRTSAILLVLTKQRWAFAAGANAVALLTGCACNPQYDVQDCLRIAAVACESVSKSADSALPSLLTALAALNTRMQDDEKSAALPVPSSATQAAATAASSSSSSPSSSAGQRCAAEVAKLIPVVFSKASLTLTDASLPTQLDAAAQQLGVDVVIPHVVSAFSSAVNEVVPKPAWSHSQQNPLIPLTAGAKFLTRFFTLEKQPSSASASSSSSSSAARQVGEAPRYDGSERSIRAICLWVLSNPASPSLFTFPATLSKAERFSVHNIATEVGGSRLRHESSNVDDRRAITVARTGKADPKIAEAPYALVRLDGDTRLPARWSDAMGSMLSALQERARQCPGTEGPEGHSNDRLQVALAFHVSMVNLLTALHAQAAEEGRATEAEGWVQAAAAVVTSLVQIAETEWPSSKSQVSIKQREEAVVCDCFEQGLLQQTLQLMDSRRDDGLASALLPLAQFVSRWLNAVVAVAAPVEWEYSTSSSHLYHWLGVSVISNWWRTGRLCSCPSCGTLERFLRSHSQRSVDFSMPQKARKHVEDSLRSLHNPHLGQETLRFGSPHTLRVTKLVMLGPLYERRRDGMQAMLIRLVTAVARIEAAAAGPASDPAGRKRQREEVVLVDDEDEEDEKQQEQTTAAGAKGGRGGKGKQKKRSK